MLARAIIVFFVSVLLTSATFAAEATKTPTDGYRHVVITSVGAFIQCTEYGHWPKCTGETELPFEGGFAQQVVRTPTGKVVQVAPDLGHPDNFVSDVVEVRGIVYVVAGHTLYRYDSHKDVFVVSYEEASFRIGAVSRTGEPYFALSESRGRDIFSGVLMLDASGKWQEFEYQGPDRHTVEKIETKGDRIILTHFAYPGEHTVTTTFDLKTDTFE
jgi:hypothetical protein